MSAVFEHIIASLDSGASIDLDAPSVVAALDSYCDCPFDTFWGFANTYRNRRLFDGRLASGWHTTDPVYAIGAGPSLTDHIPWLKENAGRYVCVASLGACPILARHRIPVHFVTPTERVVHPIPYPEGSVVAMYPWVPVLPPARSDVSVCAPDCPVSRWAGLETFGPQTLLSGMSAAHLASQIGIGDVVLLGHNLCHADDGDHHAEGYTGADYSNADMLVRCYDGKERPSTSVWRGAVQWSRRARLSATTPDSTSAVLHNVDYCPEMPVAAGKASVHHDGSTGNGGEAVAMLWELLPYDLMRFRDNGEMPDNDNRLLIEACMQPLYVAFSIERRLQRHPDPVAWFEDARRSVVNQLLIGVGDAKYAA